MTRLLRIALLTVCVLGAGCAANSTPDRKGGEEVDVRMGVVEEVRRVITPETSRRLLNNLQKVVDTGTGKEAKSSMYAIGGKTGTSQKVIGGAYSNTHHIGSFIGISPINNPKIVVLVLLDDPMGLGYGGTVAAPAVKSIVENTLQYLQVPSPTMIMTDLDEAPFE